MRICAISDVHYPQDTKGLNETVNMTNTVDALVIAGDISESLKYYDEVLKYFSKFRGLKTTVLGNHDLYAKPGSDSYQKFRNIDEICKENNFHLLDSEPIVYNGIGFVGNVGWYDYSFAQRFSDETIQIFNGERFYSKDLDELVDEDYAMKSCLGSEGVVSWADRDHIKWGYSDKEFLDIQLNKLKSDLIKVNPHSKKIVYVSHHSPFSDFVVEKKGNPQWSYFNAYQGSQRLGNLAFLFPKVSTIISGHTHLSFNSFKKGNIGCYDVSAEGKIIPRIIDV